MRYAMLWLMLLLTGCGFQEHQEQRTVQETSKIIAEHNRDVNERYLPQAQPTVVTTSNPKTGETTTTVSPPPPAVEIHTSDTLGLNAGQKSFWDDMNTSSYPLFVKLIGLALGLFLLGLLVWAWRKQSAAVDQAYLAADEALAARIRKHREKAQAAAAAGDNAAALMHTHEVAEIEADRGKLGK